MQKIDIKTVIIVLLIIINLYQFQRNLSSGVTVDISNVFLKDKIESLNISNSAAIAFHYINQQKKLS